jgi:hypothetical protein
MAYDPAAHELLSECPNCGAPTGANTTGVCEFCEVSVIRARDLPPPVGTLPPITMVGPRVMHVNRSWLAFIIVLLVVVLPLGIIAFISYGSFKAIDSFDSAAFETEIESEVERSFQQSFGTVIINNGPTSVPSVEGETIEGDATGRTIDCSQGQNYTIKGNLAKVTSTSGVCGTIVVLGNATTVHLAAAREVWAAGNACAVRVTEVSTLHVVGNACNVTWTRGIDGATPTINQGGALNTVQQG